MPCIWRRAVLGIKCVGRWIRVSILKAIPMLFATSGRKMSCPGSCRHQFDIGKKFFFFPELFQLKPGHGSNMSLTRSTPKWPFCCLCFAHLANMSSPHDDSMFCSLALSSHIKQCATGDIEILHARQYFLVFLFLLICPSHYKPSCLPSLLSLLSLFLSLISFFYPLFTVSPLPGGWMNMSDVFATL